MCVCVCVRVCACVRRVMQVTNTNSNVLQKWKAQCGRVCVYVCVRVCASVRRVLQVTNTNSNVLQKWRAQYLVVCVVSGSEDEHTGFNGREGAQHLNHLVFVAPCLLSPQLGDLEIKVETNGQCRCFRETTLGPHSHFVRSPSGLLSQPWQHKWCNWLNRA